MISHEAPANVALHLPRRAAEEPDRLAVAFREGGRWLRWSYRKLEEESNRLARGLARAGVGRGTRAALMVPPGPEFFALTFGLFKAGAVPVLVDPGMGLRNVKPCLDDAEPSAFIGTTKAHLARVLFGWAKRTARTTITVGPRLCWLGRTLDQVRDPDAAPFFAQTRPQDTAAILFTSGATGTPKGAVYTHANFAAQVELLRTVYGIEPGEVDLPTFPLFALFAPALGMSSVIPEMDFTRPAQADPERLLAAIREFGVTQMFGSPALLNAFGRRLEDGDLRLPTVRRVVSAGAPVPAAVLARVAPRIAPGGRVFTPYGATEALPVCNASSDELLGAASEATARGEGVLIGRPVPGIELRVLRIVDGPISSWSQELLAGDGEVGELAVRGPVVTRGYCRRPEADAAAKIPCADGGFFHRMGDLGRRDASGRFWFYGRKAHRVRTARGDLYTIACEGVFNAHPEVHRTALVGVGAPGAARPALCVELEPAARAADRMRIARELRALGSRFPHTRGIETVLFHDSFPVDIRHNAKIFREKLAAWAAARA